jgi:hypothetical protein
MRKISNLSQCFLICAALLVSSKSFAEVCPSSGITTSITCTGNMTTSGISFNNHLTSNIISTANMTGNISTIDSSAHGIYLGNNTGSTNISTVNMIGNITTEGDTARGIYFNNHLTSNIISTANMTGNISTTGASAYGIYLSNYITSNITNTINMSGNITTTGAGAYGIYLYNYAAAINNNTTVNMSGNIATSDANAIGIYLYNYAAATNNNSTVNMSGDITTSGASAHGILLDNSAAATNNNSTVNMSGNITTTGGVGIYLANSSDVTNNNNTVNMSGNIKTISDYANGIVLSNYGSSSTNTVNMTGNISTGGTNAHGIYLLNSTSANNTNTVNMTGNISTTGSTSYGIYLNNSSGGTNNNNTVNISGRISATGSSSYAIYAANYGSTSPITVQLNKGSSVIGGIIGLGSSSANNFLNLNLGAGASYSFATTGFTVTDLNGRPMVAGSAHAAGVGNITTASQSLYERTSQITQSLDDRVRTYDAKQNTSQDFWVNTYYSDSNRGGQGLSGSNLSFNQYRSGITAGFNMKNSYTPTELVVNFDHGKLNIDEGNQGISSNSVMAGTLFPDIKKLFTGTLSAKAMVGYSDFSGDRKVLTNDIALNGSRNVTASYQSSHLTIGSAWTKTLYQTDKIILDTLVGIDLNTQHINSYSESDLFKWNGRTINQLQERVTLGMEIKPLVKPLTLYGRVGIERRDLISGENQHYAINNTAVSYNDSNQRNTYATLNAGAYYPLTSTVKAYAQVRYYDSIKDIDSLSGSIGISGQF